MNFSSTTGPTTPAAIASTAVLTAPTEITEIPSKVGLWTRGMIFNQPELRFLHLPPHPTTGRFTPEFLSYLNQERKWMRIEEQPDLSSEQQKAVGTGAEECPLCRENMEVSLLHCGEVTGVTMYRYVACFCGIHRKFWLLWRNVPERFQQVQFATLTPRAKDKISAERQAAILAALQSHPRHSYFLYGPPGTGKTHFATALYREAVEHHAIEEWRRIDWCPSVWRTSTSVLLNEHTDWERRDQSDPDSQVKTPSVGESNITRAAKKHYRPCLFLDEIDKFSATDFKLGRLCELVNAVYEANGQVVATSNKSAEFLAQKWGDDEAGTILRRIGAGDTAHTVLFEG